MSTDNATGNLNSATPFDSSDDFFDKLDSQVNNTQEVTQSEKSATPTGNSPTKQTGSKRKSNWESENNPYKQKAHQLEKRYADSSRAGQASYQRLKEVEQFLPVLDAMKEDSGLVEHVRSYLQGGGAPPKTVQEELNLKEDFVFDGHEAVTDQSSDSAKVFNLSVDNMVKQRVGQILSVEKGKAQEAQQRTSQRDAAIQFQHKHKLSDEKMGELMEFARDNPLTLDHIYALKTMPVRDKAVANAVKKDMLGQMKTAQGMPTSASGANSQADGTVSSDDQLFASLFGEELENDNLFG
jgi:hypothetical protein